MKSRLFGIALAIIVMSGCASRPELVKTTSGNDIFREVTEGAIPQGYADLRITSSLKTHNPGVYASKKDVHGTEDYKMLVNIDGQTAQLQSNLRPENIESFGQRDPEAGQGTRYEFQKKVRLKAGKHKIVIVIPADDVTVEQEFTLAEGSSNSLVLEPVYRLIPEKQRPGFYGVTRFTEGIKGFTVLLNGKAL